MSFSTPRLLEVSAAAEAPVLPAQGILEHTLFKGTYFPTWEGLFWEKARSWPIRSLASSNLHVYARPQWHYASSAIASGWSAPCSLSVCDTSPSANASHVVNAESARAGERL